MFPQFIEINRQLDSTDLVDKAIGELNHSILILEQQSKTLQALETAFYDRPSEKLRKRYTKELETREALYQDSLIKREAIWSAMDADSNWIFRFQSLVGEAFLKTREEALELASRFVVINDKLIKDTEQLAAWKRSNKSQIFSNLSPIKLGIGGGTYKFPVISSIYISALNW